MFFIYILLVLLGVGFIVGIIFGIAACFGSASSKLFDEYKKDKEKLKEKYGKDGEYDDLVEDEYNDQGVNRRELQKIIRDAVKDGAVKASLEMELLDTLWGKKK